MASYPGPNEQVKGGPELAKHLSRFSESFTVHKPNRIVDCVKENNERTTKGNDCVN